MSDVPQGGHLSPLLFSIFINSVSNILSSSRVLCFADDIKLYSRISSDDYILLQSDFDRFIEWFNLLGLSLNVSKCKTMTFARIKSPVIYAYHLRPTAISCSNGCVTDLRFILSSYLDPDPTLSTFVVRLLKLWGLY